MGLTVGLLEKSFPKSFLALSRFHKRIDAIGEIPPAVRASLKTESFAVALTLADEMYAIKDKLTAASPVALQLIELLRKKVRK